MSHESQQQKAIDGRKETEILESLRRCALSDSYWEPFMVLYANVVEQVIVSRLDQDPKKFGSQAAYMTGLSGIATLLAGSQIAFVQILIADPICVALFPNDCGSHSPFLRDVVIFLTYIALSFEILGALSSLLTARRLMDLSSHARALLEAKNTLEKSIGSQPRGDIRSDELMAYQRETDTLFTAMRNHISRRNHTSSGLQGVVFFIFFGLVCFFAALIFEVVISQPENLSIPFGLCVAVMVTVLGFIEKRAHPGLREKWRAAHGDQEAAVETLDRFTFQNAAVDPHVTKHLDRLLQSGDLDAIEIIVTLAKYDRFRQKHNALVRQVVNKRGDQNVGVRIAALKTASYFLFDDAVRNDLCTPEARESLFSMMAIDQQSEVRRSALEIIATFSEDGPIRAAMCTHEVMERIISTVLERDSNLQQAAVNAIAALIQQNDVCRGTFTRDSILQIMSITRSEVEASWNSVLTILSTLVRCGRFLAPASIVLDANGGQGSRVGGDAVCQLLINIISLTLNISSIANSLIFATLCMLQRAQPEIRKSYIDVIRMMPWGVTLPSMATTNNLLALLSNVNLVESAIQIILCCSANAEFRQRIYSSDKLVDVLDNHPAQALELVTNLAKYADARQALGDLDSALVRRLLTNFRKELDPVRWKIYSKCLIVLGLI
ncbi:hypothetical protein B0H14DRAFT_2678923 [Mycena olivaceomarginata]|nr:hypothetical protein B0H14DRAFT_2678923 [Mycena olivaceomarginata]